MAFAAHVLRIMVVSHGDVAAEYAVVREESCCWNEAHAGTRGLILLPTRSTPPPSGLPLQAAPNRQALAEADLLVGIFGAEAKPLSEASFADATEAIKRHVGAGKSARVYFSDLPLENGQIDPEQSEAVQAFKEECRAGGFAESYDSMESFRVYFREQLGRELNQPRYRWLPEATPPAQDADDALTYDARQMLVTATLSHGMISMHPSLGGEVIRAGREILSDGTPRRTAVLKEALLQLRNLGHVEPAGPRPGIYSLTASGYRVADKLIANEKTQPEAGFRLKAVPKIAVGEPTSQRPADQ